MLTDLFVGPLALGGILIFAGVHGEARWWWALLGTVAAVSFSGRARYLSRRIRAARIEPTTLVLDGVSKKAQRKIVEHAAKLQLAEMPSHLKS